jgi:hypothetical protein
MYKVLKGIIKLLFSLSPFAFRMLLSLQGLGLSQLTTKKLSKSKYIYIDFTLPRYDADGGARTVFQLFNYLTRNGGNITFVLLSKEKNNAYEATYKKIGNILYCGIINLEALLSIIKPKAILIKSPEIAFSLDFILKSDQYETFYIGSDLYHLRLKHISNKNSLLDFIGKKIDYFFYKAIEIKIFKTKANILYPSSQEVSYAKKYNNNTFLMPIRLFDRKSIATNSSLIRNQNFNIIFVGSISHYPNLQGLFWFFKEVWPILINLESRVTMHIVGEGFESSFENQKNVFFHGYLSDMELEKLYRSCNVSIAPLLEGGGVKGKIIDALYYGLNVVTTSAGSQGINFNGISVFDSPDEFAQSVLSRLRKPKFFSGAVNFLDSNYSEKIFEKIFRDVK